MCALILDVIFTLIWSIFEEIPVFWQSRRWLFHPVQCNALEKTSLNILAHFMHCMRTHLHFRLKICQKNTRAWWRGTCTNENCPPSKSVVIFLFKCVVIQFVQVVFKYGTVKPQVDDIRYTSKST